MQLATIHTNAEPPRRGPDREFLDMHVAACLRDVREQLALDPDVAAVEQIGGESHYRFDCADGQIVGHFELCGVTEGILLQASEGEALWPRVVAVSSPDVMRVRISLEGSEVVTRDGERTVITEGPIALVVLEPQAQPPGQVVFSGRQTMVNLFADREALQELWQGREHELPTLLQAFLAGTLTQTATRRLPLRTDLLHCLEDLRRCEHEGFARTLFVRAKGFEILCHILRMLEIDESLSGADASSATSKGVLRAQQILKQRFVSPPSLDDLAKEVGVSRSGLCAGFRQIVGKSIFGYIQELRMERALELLTDRIEPITEVAYAVGYSHQSSFTVAVQRRFGMSPSELRRCGRPIEA
jgi:AraC-like DNA-binding protein